jgi:hypothetical protein
MTTLGRIQRIEPLAEGKGREAASLLSDSLKVYEGWRVSLLHTGGIRYSIISCMHLINRNKGQDLTRSPPNKAKKLKAANVAGAYT